MEERWTIRLMKLSTTQGRLTRVFAHVCSESSGVVGSIEFRGRETSSVLAMLCMSSNLEVVDCTNSLKAQTNRRTQREAWRERPLSRPRGR